MCHICYAHHVKKTMVYLDDAQHTSLVRRAHAAGTSMADLIRKAVAAYLIDDDAPPDLSFIGAATGPKQGDTSERDEEILREIFK